jgi:hypothetical protein
MSAVYFIQEAERGVAVWRASDEAPDVFLCSVTLDAYNSEPQVRDRFAALVGAVADHCRRKHVAEAIDPTAWFDELPCTKCTSPEAADVLHHARQAGSINELRLTGSGYVAGCCKSRVVGVIGGRPDTLQSTAY